MNRKEILREAERIVMGSRQENYGSPESNFANIAAYWSVYLHKSVSPADVAVMMILMKAARLSNKIDHTDSWVDIAGYAANGAELTEKKS